MSVSECDFTAPLGFRLPPHLRPETCQPVQEGLIVFLCLGATSNLAGWVDCLTGLKTSVAGAPPAGGCLVHDSLFSSVIGPVCEEQGLEGKLHSCCMIK